MELFICILTLSGVCVTLGTSLNLGFIDKRRIILLLLSALSVGIKWDVCKALSTVAGIIVGSKANY